MKYRVPPYVARRLGIPAGSVVTVRDGGPALPIRVYLDGEHVGNVATIRGWKLAGGASNNSENP